MRTIGNLGSEQAASQFSAYLLVNGIDNDVEAEEDGAFSLWIHDDEHLARAKKSLAQFLANPNAGEFAAAAQKAPALRVALESGGPRRSTVIDSARLAYEEDAVKPLPLLSYVAIIFCVAVAIYSNLGENDDALRWLTITEMRQQGNYVTWLHGLPDVLSGQVWRLITPIFIHHGPIHILFNMMMFKDLAPFIERRFGTLYLVGLIVLSAGFSNYAQYLYGGPMFGGMSGVNYALFGFLWMRGKFDPASGVELHPSTVQFLIGWFVLCIVGEFVPMGMLSHVANVAHAGGLAVGMAWGYLSARARFSR